MTFIDESPRKLDAVQRWFHAVMIHPGGVEAGMAGNAAQRIARLDRDDLEQMVLRSPTLSAHDRLAVYANAYYARLLECMAESFPVFQKTLGEELFNDFALTYLQDYPPESYSLNRLADHFAEFLDRSRPPSSRSGAEWSGFLVELARLEWTIAQVFDGPGIEGIRLPGPKAWQSVAPEMWAEARLTLAPCLRLLACRYPVNHYYGAARSTETVPDPPAPVASWIAVSRRDYVVRRHELEKGEYQLLDAVKEGATIGEAIERCADAVSLDDSALAESLQRWFQRWSREGFVVAIRSGET